MLGKLLFLINLLIAGFVLGAVLMMLGATTLGGWVMMCVGTAVMWAFILLK